MEFKEINEEKDQVIEFLKQKVKDFKILSQENDKNSAILAKLFDGGIINEDGEMVNQHADEEDM